jgi:hypothetical protein
LSEQLSALLKSVERFVPPVVAALLFLLLFVANRFLDWLPLVILSVIFPILKALRMVETVSELVEVKRMVVR